MKNLQALKSNSRFQSHSISLFFIRFFSTIASFIVIYYYSHHLSEADYGSYQAIWTRSFFLSAFAGLGVASLVFTYTPAVLKKLLTSRLLRSYAPILLVPFACSIVFAILQAEDINSFIIYLVFFGLYIACNTVEVILGALHLFRFLPVISFLYALGFCLVHYFVYSNGFDVHILFTLLIPLLLLRLTGYIWLYKKGLKTITGYDGETPDDTGLKSLWKHLYFFEASQVIILYADKFLLAHFLPVSQFAVYFNATISIPFIGLVFSAVNNAAFMEYAHQPDKKSRIAVLHQTGKVLASAAFPCFFFLLFFSEELFSVLFSKKYLESIPIFTITLLALPVRLVYAHTLVLQSNHRGGIINKGVVIDVLVSLALFAPLYAVMELKGVALAFVIGTYAQALYYLIRSGKIMGVSPLHLIPVKNWLLKFISFGVSIFLIHRILQYYAPYLPGGNIESTDVLVLLTGGLLTGTVSGILFWKAFKPKDQAIP